MRSTDQRVVQWTVTMNSTRGVTAMVNMMITLMEGRMRMDCGRDSPHGEWTSVYRRRMMRWLVVVVGVSRVVCGGYV